jgi:hypothetical protein
MKNFSAAFEDFQKALGDNIDISKLTNEDIITMGDVWTKTHNFLIENNLILDNAGTEKLNFTKPAVESVSDVVLNTIGNHGIRDFVEGCKVPKELVRSATESVAFIMSNPKLQNVSPQSFLETNTIDENGMTSRFFSTDQYLPQRSLNRFVDYDAALEDFGKNSDMIVADLRLSVAVTILKYHQGITDRLIHRKPTSENVVRFRLMGGEVLDLSDSTATKDNPNKTYNTGIPFIDLYHNPEPVNTKPKPVVPLKVNDTGASPVLHEDGLLRFGTDVPTLNLSLKNEIGYDRLDYSDLVADGVCMKNYVLTLVKDNGTDPAVTETFEIDLSGRPSARFLMQMNTRHSADRSCNLREKIVLRSTTPKADGTASTILADFTGDHIIDLDLKIDGDINLNNGIVNCRQTPSLKLVTVDGSTPLPEVSAAFGVISVNLEESGYRLDEYFSEENIRKSSTVIRTVTKSLAYEIPLGKNIMVDFSLSETRPEEALGLVSEALLLGCDNRNVNVLIDQINSAYDRIQNEKSGVIDVSNRTSIRYDYAAGLRVNPYIFRDTFDLTSQVVNEETGKIFGDIRTAVDKYFLQVFSSIHSKSLYVNSLAKGERPVYRVLTSGPIKENLFQIPHYHNHLDSSGEQGDGSDVEYIRVLPSGVVLEIFTTSWDMFSDKILILPYRKGMPEEVNNFGFNADMGSFTANINVSSAGANYRRIVTNAKEIPIVTNPVAALVTVTGLGDILSD